MSALPNKKNGSAAHRAIEMLGGPSKVAKLLAARGIEITPWAVNKWRTRLPPDRVLLIEELTGNQVTRHELRPDIYPLERTA